MLRNSVLGIFKFQAPTRYFSRDVQQAVVYRSLVSTGETQAREEHIVDF